MMKNRDWHKDFSKIPGLQKAGYRHRDSGYRHRDSGVASPRFLHINTEKNLCLYLLFISYPLCLSLLSYGKQPENSGKHFDAILSGCKYFRCLSNYPA